MLERIRYPNREKWLEAREHSIGASEAAACIGVSPFMSNVSLWKLKVGLEHAKDISGNAAVEYGNRLEPAMRAMFAAEHPEMRLVYHQFDMLRQSERPWLTATLDGELVELGRKDWQREMTVEELLAVPMEHRGILEVKTAQVSTRAQWQRWKDQVPQHYYIQCLHQLIATQWGFVILYAKLVKLDGDSELRTYRFNRADCQADMDYLLEKETSFWNGNVLARKQPAAILPSL